MKSNTVLLFALCVICLAGCRNFDPFGVEERRQAGEAEQQRLTRLQNIEEKKAGTVKGEDLVAYLSRVSESKKQDGGLWEFKIDPALVPSVSSFSRDKLSILLELERSDNWLDTPPPSFENIPVFWSRFLKSKEPFGYIAVRLSNKV